GIVIHVVSVAHLCGPAVPAPVMGNHPVAMMQEEQHLRVPIVGRQWPSVTENDRLTGTPVLVEDLGSVSGRELGHFSPLFSSIPDVVAARQLPAGPCGS